MRVDEPLSELGYTVTPMETGAELVVGRALVVVVDDRTAHGDEDHSGPLVTELLTEAGFGVGGGVAGVILLSRWAGRVSRRAMSPRRPPARSWIGRSSVSRKPFEGRDCPRESSTPDCPVVWPVCPGAPWW